MNRVLTVPQLWEYKRRQEKIACLTVYDATFARVLEKAGVEVLLVGDSLGMVIQGRETTVPVTVEQMIYHTECVSRAAKRALRVVDLPFASYASPGQAVESAARLLRAGAGMVKLEGGRGRVEVVRALVAEGIPVCGHLGLLPQSIHRLGAYKVQATGPQSAQHLLEDACLLEQAGIDLLVLECIPATLAESVSAEISVPTVGIGAGAGCDGQVLVLYDLLGLGMEEAPRFVRNFLAEVGSIEAAVAAYVQAVKEGSFPAAEHTY